MGKQIQVNPEVAKKLDGIRENMGSDVSYSRAIAVIMGLSVCDNTFNKLLDEVELLAQAYIRSENDLAAIKLNVAQCRITWSKQISR